MTADDLTDFLETTIDDSFDLGWTSRDAATLIVSRMQSEGLVLVPAQPASGDVAIPREIAEQVLSMGRVEWCATAEYNDAGHLAHLAESLRITRDHFNLEDLPVSMHGLYLEGTETVLCHTGTSPNSGTNAQALTGAWNWLHDQCAALSRYEKDRTDG